jgi:hypothetical protein
MSAVDGELTALCQSCGLCCDGSLFGRVDLAPDEVEPARRHGLRVLGNGRSFRQPCAALVPLAAAAELPRRACSSYEHRPAACRRFVCRLYDRHRREGGPLEPRLAAVQRVRQLLAALESQPRAPELVDELAKRVEDDFARA